MTMPRDEYRVTIRTQSAQQLEACSDCERIYPGVQLLPRRVGRICEPCLDRRYDLGLEQ